MDNKTGAAIGLTLTGLGLLVDKLVDGNLGLGNGYLDYTNGLDMLAKFSTLAGIGKSLYHGLKYQSTGD